MSLRVQHVAPEQSAAEIVRHGRQNALPFREEGRMEGAELPQLANAPEAGVVTAEPAPGNLLVEDDTTDLAPGRMRKSDFLVMIRDEICARADELLVSAGRSTEGCPYVDFWFSYYSARDSAHIENAIRRYAPETATAATAQDYIESVRDRMLRAVEIWVRTGAITGVPEGLETPTGAPAPHVAAKAREGGLRNASDPRALQAQLGAGRPLDSSVQSGMESAFGHNFSRVRVHTDGRAADIASSINARAFTIGDHVAFASGEYQPGSLLGDALIAHELAHVAQQSTPGSSVVANDAMEEDADRSAVGVMASLWGKGAGKFSDLARDAGPRLRSGIQLARCSSSKVTKVSVTKQGQGWDDFEAKRGGGKTLGYHFGWHNGSWYANFRYIPTIDVEGDINKCTYEQTINAETSFNKWSGDDTYTELTNRPLKTDQWVKVEPNKVMWQDAPGLPSDQNNTLSDLPYFFKADFTQAGTGTDGVEVKVAWKVHYALDAAGAWTKKDDGLDVEAKHP